MLLFLSMLIQYNTIMLMLYTIHNDRLVYAVLCNGLCLDEICIYGVMIKRDKIYTKTVGGRNIKYDKYENG